MPLTPVLPAKIWYKAEHGVTYNTAGELTMWEDANGNGFDIVPAGGKSVSSNNLMNGHSMVQVQENLLRSKTMELQATTRVRFISWASWWKKVLW